MNFVESSEFERGLGPKDATIVETLCAGAQVAEGLCRNETGGRGVMDDASKTVFAQGWHAMRGVMSAATKSALIAIIVASIGSASPSVAQTAQPENMFNGEIDEFYTGIRQMSMGGAYVNVVNDETALLTNPAGLGRLRDLTFTVFDPELHGAFKNTESVTLDNYSGALDIQQLLEILNRTKGNHWHFKGQVFPSFIAPNFGIGLLAKYQYNARVDPTGTTYRLDYVSDWAAAMGATLRFWDGIIKFGFAGRLVNRTEIHKDLPANSTGLEIRSQAKEGIGAAGDVGLLITAPWKYLPSIGAVVRDVGDTSYTLREGMFYGTSERPDKTDQRVDVGLSFQPILGNRVRMLIALEYRGVTSPIVPEYEDAIKRSHAGMELNVADFFFLRAGANQGYWTGGVEFATEKFQLQAGSYGEEIGTPTGRREDRRWMGKFSLRF